MKLYYLWTNSGNWNDALEWYVIANSKEEAIQKCEGYQDRVSCGYDHFVIEVTGERLLAQLIHTNDKENYEMTYKITAK